MHAIYLLLVFLIGHYFAWCMPSETDGGLNVRLVIVDSLLWVK